MFKGDAVTRAGAGRSVASQGFSCPYSGPDSVWHTTSGFRDHVFDASYLVCSACFIVAVELWCLRFGRLLAHTDKLHIHDIVLAGTCFDSVQVIACSLLA